MMLPPCLIQVPLLLSLAATSLPLPPPPPPTTTTTIPAFVVPEVAAGIVSSNSNDRNTARHLSTSSTTENYLPRRLYPGTYANYCGPTPEITVRDSCRAHGWHGDQAVDDVDAACRLHDVSYCSCEAQLLSRLNRPDDEQQQIPGLSSLIALRFITLPVAQTLLSLDKAVGIDNEYLDCIHRADVRLITTGISIRQQQQQSNCDESTSAASSPPQSLLSFLSSLSLFSSASSDTSGYADDSSSTTSPSNSNNSNNKLKWFCQLEEQDESAANTLSAFEKVSLAIFLRNLDFDYYQQQQQQQQSRTTNNNKNNKELLLLTQLEAKRQADFRSELNRGKSIAAAIASPNVQRDEQEMLDVLQQQSK
jgi:hypothetical protein